MRSKMLAGFEFEIFSVSLIKRMVISGCACDWQWGWWDDDKRVSVWRRPEGLTAGSQQHNGKADKSRWPLRLRRDGRGNRQGEGWRKKMGGEVKYFWMKSAVADDEGVGDRNTWTDTGAGRPNEANIEKIKVWRKRKKWREKRLKTVLGSHWV